MAGFQVATYGRFWVATEEEALVAQFLTRHGIRYEREKVWANGPKPITSDFWLPDHAHTLEIDGAQHKLNPTYDRKRTMFLATHYRVGTIRFTNSEVDHGYAADRLMQMLGLRRLDQESVKLFEGGY